MQSLTLFDKYVYTAIVELTKASPDGELAYNKYLLTFLRGESNKVFPWEVISKSKVYGKFPKVNQLSLALACNRLESCKYITKIQIDNNYKFIVCNKPHASNTNAPSFSKSLSKYKKYLLEMFITTVLKYCPSLVENDQGSYLGIKLKGQFHKSFRNWLWINDPKLYDNYLNITIRYRPDKAGQLGTFKLSSDTFPTIINSFFEILKKEKDNFSLVFSGPFSLPNIASYSSSKQQATEDRKAKIIDFSFFATDEMSVYLNNGDDCSIDVFLTTSENSPYKYTGETIISPLSIRKLIKEDLFDFSIKKWKLVAWSASKESSFIIQNVLLLSKKVDNLWVVLALPKRKVVLITENSFYLPYNSKNIHSSELIAQFSN